MNFSFAPLAVVFLSVGVGACATSPADGADTSAAAIVAAEPPAILLSCKDKADATRTALLTVDPNAHFSWNIGGGDRNPKKGVLVEVHGPTTDDEAYTFHDTSGYYVSFDLESSTISEGGLDVECDAATMTLDTNALDALVTATKDSLTKAKPYAVCPQAQPAEGTTGPNTVTVRPALAGQGAILEGDDSDGDGWVLFATKTRASAGKVSYSGAGALTVFAAGQHVSSFSSFTAEPATGGSTLGWNAHVPLRPEGPCNVTGDAYAGSLIAGN